MDGVRIFMNKYDFVPWIEPGVGQNDIRRSGQSAPEIRVDLRTGSNLQRQMMFQELLLTDFIFNEFQEIRRGVLRCQFLTFWQWEIPNSLRIFVNDKSFPVCLVAPVLSHYFCQRPESLKLERFVSPGAQKSLHASGSGNATLGQVTWKSQTKIL